MILNKQQLIQTLHDFVLQHNPDNDTRIQIKYEHTLCVAKIAEQIARDLNLPAQNVQLAWLGGLLHDYGRFPQIAEYNTFRDARSISHAELGADLLFKDHDIAKFISSNDIMPGSIAALTLEDAIRQHSSLYIADNPVLNALYPGQDPYWLHKIIRDADKIDIVRLYVCHPEFSCDSTMENILSSQFSEQCMDLFLTGQPVTHSALQSPIDEWLYAAAFTYCLAYDVSLHLLLDQGYIHQLFDICKKMPQTAETLQIILGQLQLYLPESALPYCV